MSVPILQVALQSERDVVQARQRAREVAAELGLDNQDQIRLATATSEIARNAFRYASNGKVAFSLDLEQQRRSGAWIPHNDRGGPSCAVRPRGPRDGIGQILLQCRSSPSATGRAIAIATRSPLASTG